MTGCKFRWEKRLLPRKNTEDDTAQVIPQNVITYGHELMIFLILYDF